MKRTLFIVSLSIIAALVVLMSCSEDQSPARSYSTHITGWMDTSSVNFHGRAVVRDTLLYDGCKDCHGADFTGGESGVSCYTCHLYPHLAIDPAHRVSTHRALIASLNWDLTECRTCHSGDAWEGRTGVACTGCHYHQVDGGPSNCTTCHGQPPVDDTTVPYGMASGAAGGHQRMAVDLSYACSECHAAVTDLSHTGPLPAEVVFSPNSIAAARGYEPSITHVGEPNSGNATCAVYCHSNGKGSNFTMEQRQPNQPVPEWTAQNVTFTCTSCHSIPPAAPHPQVEQCSNCHRNVDPSSVFPNDIRFINPQLHINGVVDL